jgi:hypothetical protein
VRNKKLTISNFKDAVSNFPCFDGTVPINSVMLVCYTDSCYMRNGILNISHNLLWAAVLCGSNKLAPSLLSSIRELILTSGRKPFQFQSLWHDDDLFHMMADRMELSSALSN